LPRKQLLHAEKTKATKKAPATKKAVAKKAEVVEETVAQEVAVAASKVKETPAKPKAKAADEKDVFLENFNWHNYQEGIDVIEDEQLKEFEALVTENFVDTADEDVLDGTIVHLTDREAIIDINAKSEGVISLNEFRYNPHLKAGR
jgi:small subunit ribosomal protein S1